MPETYQDAVIRLALELSDFGQYPPEENTRDGNCNACGYPVQAHQGLFAQGSDSRGLFGAHLHRGCLAHVRRVRAAAQQGSGVGTRP